MIEPLAAIQSLAEMQMLATGGKHTDDHTYKSALDAYSLASTSHLQPHIDQNLCLGPVEAKLYDYRDEKVAGFDMSGQVMICLPQVFELFLKKYVGGMHTVYTKLKRLNIEPLICNVEQVRALRSLGAIQPGVNRCKLINRDDFDKLYDDCTNACARPGRPPKRSPHEDWSHIAKKEPRYDSSFDHHSFTSPQPSLSTESMTSPPPPPTGANPMQLFGNLFSFGAPQLLMQQMMAAVAQQQPQPRQNPFSNDSTFLPQTQTIIDETLDEDEGEEEEGDDDPHSSMSSTLEDNKSDDRPSSSRATAGDLSRRTTSNESNESTSNQSGVALNLITKSDESPSTKFISPRDESERTSSDRSVPLNDTESSSSSTQQMRSSGAQSAQSDTDQTLQFVLARIGNMVDLANRTFSSHHQNIIAEKNATTMLHEKLISIVDRLNEQENRLERRLDEEQRKSRSYLMRYCSARREASSLRLQVSSLKRQLASNRQQHA
ncbi:hypothetical protein QR680_014224 [Steinernema hermaphroditum]|uniref:SKI/SNO/DAC domain-containing protein n=1 Tax=Steinernema hermaphroditum TaxID=289476 RepID=A0AA39IAA1_9BILA|nr:hypothetical protein QR680_014224 [Steinernema hermaphroditum]